MLLYLWFIIWSRYNTTSKVNYILLRDLVNKGDKVIVVDDVIATGGTLLAATNLLKSSGADIVKILLLN